MQKLSQWNRFAGAHFPWFVLACAALGVLFPNVFSRLNNIMVAMFAFMTFANSLGGGFRELARIVLHPLPALVTLLMLHAVMPLLGVFAVANSGCASGPSSSYRLFIASTPIASASME